MPTIDLMNDLMNEADRASADLLTLIEGAIKEGDDSRALALDHILQSLEKMVVLGATIQSSRTILSHREM
jgi:hypothetical protein